MSKAYRNSTCPIQAIQSSYPLQPYCAIKLTLARRNSPAPIKAGTTAHKQNLTPENCSKVPIGPSNLSTYLQCDQAFERTALGLRSNRDQDTLAQFLEEMGETLGGYDSQGGEIAEMG
jgi:hypothetical protein